MNLTQKQFIIKQIEDNTFYQFTHSETILNIAYWYFETFVVTSQHINYLINLCDTYKLKFKSECVNNIMKLTLTYKTK